MAKHLLDPNNSVLLVVDIQDKFVPTMYNMQQLVKNSGILIQAAAHLGIPVMVSEHYPKGLGHTVAGLKTLLPENTTLLEKTAFGCLGDNMIRTHLASLNRNQIVVCGLEAHICVCQTVHQLISDGYEVHVAQDAVASRTAENKQAGLAKMSVSGAIPATVEMTLFEWMGNATHPAFKSIQALIK